MENLKPAQILAQRQNKVIYREDDTVVKLFDRNYSKADILNEALNHARIEETGLHVPALLEVTNYDGKWALRLEHIPGKTLQALMDEEPNKQDEYLDLFLDIQLSIFDERAPLLNKLKDKTRRKIDSSGYDATTRYELNMRLSSTPDHDKICHGDFVPSNIIIQPDGTPCILDWSHVTQGNASADAVLTYLLFLLDGKEDLAKEYLKRFCLKTDTAMQYVQRWMPVVAAAQSVKEKPEEKEFLSRWVHVADYE